MSGFAVNTFATAGALVALLIFPIFDSMTLDPLESFCCGCGCCGLRFGNTALLILLGLLELLLLREGLLGLVKFNNLKSGRAEVVFLGNKSGLTGLVIEEFIGLAEDLLKFCCIGLPRGFLGSKVIGRWGNM